MLSLCTFIKKFEQQKIYLMEKVFSPHIYDEKLYLFLNAMVNYTKSSITTSAYLMAVEPHSHL